MTLKVKVKGMQSCGTSNFEDYRIIWESNQGVVKAAEFFKTFNFDGL